MIAPPVLLLSLIKTLQLEQEPGARLQHTNTIPDLVLQITSFHS